MTDHTAPIAEPEPGTASGRAALKRLGATFGALGLSAYGLGAVLTYSPVDPSLNVATGEPARNLFGEPGAVTADLILQAGGVGAVIGLIALGAAGGLRLAHGAAAGAVDKPRLLAGAAGVALLAAAASTLPSPGVWPLAVGMGGMIGDALALLQTTVFSIPGLPGARVLAGLLSSVAGAALMAYAFSMRRETVESAIASARRGATRATIAAERLLTRHAPELARALPRPQPTRPNQPPAERPSHVNLPVRPLTPITPESAAPLARRRPAETEAGYPLHAAASDGPKLKIYQPEPQMPAEPLQTHLQASSPGKVTPFPTVRQPVQPAAAPQPSNAVQIQTPAPWSPSPQARYAQDGVFELPTIDLLTTPRPRLSQTDGAALQAMARRLAAVLADFGVQGEIVSARPGPVVTLFELEPAPGVKTNRVITLADDIARSMSATSARVAVISGRNAIGIELPNPKRETVFLRTLLGSTAFVGAQGGLPIALGETIEGEPFVADLAKMPHLLIAGTTGSGKSVGINAMIVSLLYRYSPDECRFIMIDPKMLELSVYEGIPHLLSPVVTDPKKAVVALKWAVREMEERYQAMSLLRVRHIHGYNERIQEAKDRGEPLEQTVTVGFDPDTGAPIMESRRLPMEPMPFIVVVIDEMADLMMTAGKEIEAAVQRLAQMARAAGIHVIMATQRPSVDVITGTIKANFPTRVSYAVTSKIDSRTILGEQGAEQLLGQGDLLYMAGGGRIRRLHGPYVSDGEVERVVNILRAQGAPVYRADITEDEEDAEDAALDLNDPANMSGDELYDRAVEVVRRDGKASTSYIQRRLSVGYNKAASLIERMEQEGIISAASPTGKREVILRSVNER
jgi:S-DNA-T family DNA segregation ATPase FtsK/SpoIIIE